MTAANVNVSEGLVSESCPEEVIGTSNSNGSSQKSDFDSVGQETAKFMMSFLLPQAIPLLKKAPRKKKAAASPPLENMPFGENTLKQNKETNVSTPGVVSFKISTILFFNPIYFCDHLLSILGFNI